MESRLKRELATGELGAIAALAFLLLATASWWALALWPAPEAPDWLARARFVCFNSAPNGLPDAAGWLLLAGEPLGMLGALLAIWGDPLRRGIRALAGRAGGRLALALCGLSLLCGIGAAGARIARADPELASVRPFEANPQDAAAAPRQDRPAPELGLVDQHGRELALAALRGRPALVTFAFGHCESVCPALVARSTAAQAQLRERARAGQTALERIPRVVIVTLDPWRDTPARLPQLAARWRLPAGEAFLLSGEIERVDAVLDAFAVPRERNASSGDLAHPPLTYVLDAEGKIAFASTGSAAELVALLARL